MKRLVQNLPFNVLEKNASHVFLNRPNSVNNQSILISFGIQHPEVTCHWTINNLPINCCRNSLQVNWARLWPIFFRC